MANDRPWHRCHSFWLEIFVLLNLAGLTPDIYLAHMTNRFRESTEYVPLYFSPTAAVVLLGALFARAVWGRVSWWRTLGHLIGWASVAMGIVGVILHLESQFFRERTLASLVYSAPFAAPVAYVGLGLLLIMNRMVDPASVEWPEWVLFFALGGYVGNFVFSLTDHAVNGFYSPSEWIPVISAAIAIGFLLVVFLAPLQRSFLAANAFVLLGQGIVGLLGTYFHGIADVRGPMPTLFENVVSGAPVLAPLLFADLMLLGFLGLWVLHRHLPSETVLPLACQESS